MRRRVLALACLSLAACNKDNPLFGLEYTTSGEVGSSEPTSVGEVPDPSTTSSSSGGAIEDPSATTDPGDTTTDPGTTTLAPPVCPIGQPGLDIRLGEQKNGDLIPQDQATCGLGPPAFTGERFRVEDREGATLFLRDCPGCEGDCGDTKYELTLDFPQANAALAPFDDACVELHTTPNYVLDLASNTCGFDALTLRVVAEGAPPAAVPHLVAYRSNVLDATFGQGPFHLRHDAASPLPGCEGAACMNLGPAGPRATSLTAWLEGDAQPTPLGVLDPGESLAGASFSAGDQTYEVDLHLVRAELDPDCARASVDWVAGFRAP